MKIALIYPLYSLDTKILRNRYKESGHGWMPLGIAYIAAVLIKNGHAVRFFDRTVMCIKNNFNLTMTDKQCVSYLNDFAPDIVGFSATTPLMCDVKHFSDIIKSSMPDIKIVVGGCHPTVEPEESVKACPAVDIAVRGEGENTIINVVNNLDKLATVKGISFRSGEKIISNEAAKQITDLDSIPMPQRDLFSSDIYCKKIVNRNFYGRFASCFFSRGCNNRCNFCSGYDVFKKGIRFHSSGRVVSEVEDIISRRKPDYLYFTDDNFLFSKEWVENVCRLLIQSGVNKKVKWIVQGKPEKDKTDEALFRLMKEAGCVQLEFGFESGSQAELDRMNKRTKADDYNDIVQMTKRSGMRCYANIMLNYPGQTADDFKETIYFIRNSKPSVVQGGSFLSLPGSPANRDLMEKGHKFSWDIAMSYRTNFSAMSDEEFRKIHTLDYLPLITRINSISLFKSLILIEPLLLFRHFILKIPGTFKIAIKIILGTISWRTLTALQKFYHHLKYEIWLRPDDEIS